MKKSLGDMTREQLTNAGIVLAICFSAGAIIAYAVVLYFL